MANKEYEIDYSDKRFTDVKEQETNALEQNNAAYTQAMDNMNGLYQSQIDAVNAYRDEQTKLLDEQTDFAIEKVEQNKQKAESDYAKEQSAAYKDYQKQSNAYGANAEKMAALGLTNSGYSETAQVAMYNTYQNRVATAREAFNQAKINYDNSITEARIQNNVAKAQLAYETLVKTTELAINGAMYGNELLLGMAKNAREISQDYHQRYQDVLAQINKENALAEEIRQYNENMKFDRERFDYEKKKSSGIGFVNGGDNNTADVDNGWSFGLRNILYNAVNGGQAQSDALEPDLQNLIDIGLGDVSPEELVKLINEGKVEEYVEGNKIKYRLLNYTPKKKTGNMLGTMGK